MARYCGIRTTAFGFVLLFPALVFQAGACGPWFPNDMLSLGDRSVLGAPRANFVAQLELLRLAPARFKAVQTSDPPIERHSTDAELTDLAAALKKQKAHEDTAAEIVKVHKTARETLQDYLQSVAAWDSSRDWISDEHGGHRGPSRLPPPGFPQIHIADGLPAEFVDYFEGALAWHNPVVADKSSAREAWERLLARPPEQRRFKSTWAAFMLGRSWAEENEAEKACIRFKQVRTLAGKGFADSTGLAAASLGLEAKLHLDRKEFAQAIELYLEQLATGDNSAPESLRFTAERALDAPPEKLRALATNPVARPIITAYLVSLGSAFRFDEDPSGEPVRVSRAPATTWLATLESAGITDADLVEKLALTAYQNNDMAAAERWIRRGPNSPTAQWIQAKLYLRKGNVAKAAAQLAKAVQYFPLQLEPEGIDRSGAGRPDPQFKDCLTHMEIRSDRQVLGELGVLHLSRREYAQALHALLTAGFWKDAAYVAECVLSVDELKGYVDQHWSNASAEQLAAENEQYGTRELSPTGHRQKIRYLLARRLTRSLRGNEAREYYPSEWVPKYDELAKALRAGWDESAAVGERARALFEAAIITRTNGMELLGTELAPDGAIYAGAYEPSPMWENRATNAANATCMAKATEDEIQRAVNHRPDPDQRYHYRYQAAFLGWEAAKLMPNDSEQTARVLCIAGTWLKHRDPDTADIFYKALVRRNRKTEIGQEADRIRWFPILDTNGNLIRREERPPQGQLTPDRNGGFMYILHAGDTAVTVLRACVDAGVNVTLEDLMVANPGLDLSRLMIGQVIHVPPPAESIESGDMANLPEIENPQ